MYKVQNNYTNRDLEGNVVSHTIAIKQDDEYALIERTILGDYSNKSDEELIALVLEKFYQDTYNNRAEKEGIAELREINAKQNAVIEDATKTLNVTKNSVLELSALVSGLAEHVGYELGDEEDDEVSEIS